MERWYTQEELYWLDTILPLRKRNGSKQTDSIDDLSDEDIMMENGNLKVDSQK